MKISTELKKKSGVYKVVNIETEECYVGSSKNVYKRLNDHFSQLRSNKHLNKRLQESYNQFPLDFDYEILEFCRSEDLIDREQCYIDICKSTLNISKNAQCGGKRENAGRPKEEPTIRMTVPSDLVDELQGMIDTHKLSILKTKNEHTNILGR